MRKRGLSGADTYDSGLFSHLSLRASLFLIVTFDTGSARQTFCEFYIFGGEGHGTKGQGQCCYGMIGGARQHTDLSLAADTRLRATYTTHGGPCRTTVPCDTYHYLHRAIREPERESGGHVRE